MRANGVRGEVVATLAGAVLAALLRGGGEDALADAVTGAPLDPRQAADAVAKAFAAVA